MDSKKRLIVTSAISIILVSILMIGSTYSIFNSTDVDQEANVYQTGSLEVTLEDSNDITLDVATPLSVDAAKSLAPHRIKVTNKGTVAYQFNVILSPTTATSEIDHQYIMAKVGKLKENKLSECSDNIIASNIILPAGKSVDIDVRVWISDEVQNTEMNKSFNARLKIDGIGIYNSNDEIDNSALVAAPLTTLTLGAYVSMTPTKSSYTTDTSKTGYSSSQTINPQELNLWRVISVNDDGTVEMISEHVSSIAIYFGGQTGYQNLVGYLNVLASQYENSTYTKSSRHFGYNGQTEYITDTSKFTNPAPWTSSTGSSTVESQGGGDKLYTTDYDLVNTVLGTRVATKPDNTSAAYWEASRYYHYGSSSGYYWSGRFVSTSGADISDYFLYCYNVSKFDTRNFPFSLRPIVVLKSGLKYYGLGTENNPIEISAS